MDKFSLSPLSLLVETLTVLYGVPGKGVYGDVSRRKGSRIWYDACSVFVGKRVVKVPLPMTDHGGNWLLLRLLQTLESY